MQRCTEKVIFSLFLIGLVLIPAAIPVHSPQRNTRNHALLEAAGPSHVAINAISANMDSFSSSRTAALKKQPSHMEAAHFGDLGKISALGYYSQSCLLHILYVASLQSTTTRLF